MGTVSDSEIYPNAPVVLVAAEIKHPTAAEFGTKALGAAKRSLAAVCPLYKPGTFTTMTAVAGSPPDVTTVEVPRFTSRDRTLSVSFRRDALVVESTAHERFEQLRAVLGAAVEARQAVHPVNGIERMGLRYIDEIRVPDANGADVPWASWVDDRLLGPALAGVGLGLKPTGWLGLVEFAKSPEHTIALRYGAREGYAVDPAGDLRRRTPRPGPFFLLDIDSFWQPAGEVPTVELGSVLELADQLHAPIREMFEALITDRLRNEVLRRGE